MHPVHLLVLTLASNASDTIVLPVSEQVLRASAHYSAVVDELSAADTRHLTDIQRAARLQLVDALRAYRDRAEFGRGYDEGARVPYFVDAEGRRCAVAELLHVSGELGLVERVRTSNNHAWILDLAGDAAFEDWLDRHGLAFDEAARVQVPVIGQLPRFDTNGHPGGGGGPIQRPTGGSYRGPGDTVGPAGPPGPTAPTGSGTGPATGGPGASVAGTGPRPVGAGPSTGAVPTTVSMSTTSDDGWWLWWEYAKLEFLVPNRLSLASAPSTGDDVIGSLRDAIERARRTQVPRFTEAASAPDATVRGAAAIALGQSAGRDAVAPLLKLLDDPSQDVRHRAILALGATGEPSAAMVLLRIARTGTNVEGSRADISPYARSIAIVALALARRAGLAEPVDTAVAALVRERQKDEREGVALAAMFHHGIAPGESLERLALELALDESESPSVRCRAVEALGSTHDPKTLARLQTILSGPRMDLRRSAAIALGSTRDTAVLPALQTAHEMEAEGLTRGFILVAIGRLGGAKAHQYLLKVLDQGESGQRRWAALALGVLAHDTRDPETSKSLRAAADREKSAEGRAAYWIASGLLRDESSVPGIAKELESAADPRQRMYAATALSLVGGARCAAILRERLPRESNAMARVGITQALGILGENQDVTAMRSALDQLAEPGLQGIAATALAFHGTPEALAQLGDLAASDSGARVRRAASIEGLGLMLARNKPLALADLSRRINYTVMPDWAQGLFQTML
ncbi:MAG: HEAT repeat domain-containing protein [Planctomycetota bacterium]|nr:HEAT repeat domain-containing protein [Planctomycetota bacterium]